MSKEAEDDDLFSRACGIARAEGRASNTFLQDRLGIGTGRARKLLARMEAAGVISAADALGARTVNGAGSPPAASPAAPPAPLKTLADLSPPAAPEPPSSAAPEAVGDRYAEAVGLVRANPEGFGTSFLQRRMGLGYNAAARLIERMESEGVVTVANREGKRFVRDPSNPFAPTEVPGWTNPPGKPATATAKGETKMGDVTDDEDDGEGQPKNVQAPGSNLVSGEEVRTFIERVEKVRDEKRKLSDFEKEIFAEMKSRGHDTKAVRYLLKRRTLKPSELEEFEAITELYMAAVGMLREPPLFRAVAGMGVDPNVRESVISALKMIAPMDGEITIREGSGPRIRIIRDKDGVRAEEVVDAPLAPLPGQASPGGQAAQPVPAVDDNGAFLLGKTARKEDVPVVQNPFPFGDPRRRHWDEGWRDEDGGDGFGGGDE